MEAAKGWRRPRDGGGHGTEAALGFRAALIGFGRRFLAVTDCR